MRCSDPSGGLPRRDLLMKGAVVAGAAWTAPFITSFEPVAAAAGSALGSYTYCFDDGGSLEGWTIDNTAGAGNGLWNVTTQRSFSPSFSLHYGRGIGGNYETGGRNAGTVTSPSFTVPAVGPALLELKVWRDVEVYATGRWDEFSVSLLPSGDVLYAVSRDGGTTGWEHIELNLAPYAGDDVQIVLAFDTVDGAFNDHEGIYVDNIVVPGASAPVGGLGALAAPARFRSLDETGWMPARPEPSSMERTRRN